jgi:hypothetical protein
VSKKTTKSVLCDTSFLISLYDDSRPNHEVAKKYHKHFIRNGVIMYLSVIVISEFHQVQPITDLIASGNYIVLPFNYDDALKTADTAFSLGGLDRRGESNAKFKDDLKLIGQAKNKDVDFVITEDARTLYRYCERLNKAKMLDTKPIALKDGFDASHFNGGQSTLGIEE